MRRACEIAGGKSKLAAHLGISYQSMDGWSIGNELPATDFNGKTFYAMKIQEITDGKVTIVDLLGFVPHPQEWRMAYEGTDGK